MFIVPINISLLYQQAVLFCHLSCQFQIFFQIFYVFKISFFNLPPPSVTLSQVFFKIPSGPRGNLPYTNWYGEILFVLFIVSRYAHRTKGSLLSHSFGNFVLTKWCSIFLKVEFQRSTPAFPSG